MSELIRDQNRITVAGGRSSADATVVLPIRIDSVTGRLLTDSAVGSGTVTDVSVVSANGFAGTVATSTTTPAITIQTTLGSGEVPVSNGTGFQSAPLTGTGNIVLANSPTLVTPNLGTPSTLVGTNITGTAAGLSIGGNAATATTASAVAVGGITGLGTGVATALAINVGSAGAFVTFNGALGTPSSGTVTNLTGTASININGTVGATTPNTIVGTTIQANTGFLPDANDGAYLGQAGTAFSDLFLAEGGVINWDSGDLTLTQTGNNLTLAGGEFSFGANTAYFVETDNGNSSTADTIDWKLSNKQKSTLTGNCTFTFTAPSGPCSLLLELVQDATGSRTVTWPATVHWPGGVAPTLTTTANKVDIITFFWNGTTYFGNSALNYTA